MVLTLLFRLLYFFVIMLYKFIVLLLLKNIKYITFTILLNTEITVLEEKDVNNVCCAVMLAFFRGYFK
jgi:hypothetical protein